MVKLSKRSWKHIQERLRDFNFYTYAIDGIPGKLTVKALDMKIRRTTPDWHIRYERKLGLEDLINVFSDTEVVLPPWLEAAGQEYGVTEIKGKVHNKKVLGYWERIKVGIFSDEVPWCASFVGAMLEKVGYTSTRRGNARSYNKWGDELVKPAVGAIAVFWRGSYSSWKGHVGFVVGKNKKGELLVLGGNQGDEVNIRSFSVSRLLSLRWPKNCQHTCFGLPTFNLYRKSTSEE